MSVLLVLVLFCLSGCSITSKRLQSTLVPASGIGDSVFCAQGCASEWARAQLWIVNHAHWKIQTANDVLIQTYNPGNSDVSYGFTITKEPHSDGRSLIRLALACGNMFGCDPTPDDVRKAFYYYVKNGIDLLIGHGYLGAIR